MLSAAVSCITPLAGNHAPGVLSAWMTSSVAITENAIPSRTTRPSFARAAITDNATAATAASAPATPTTTTCTNGAIITCPPAVTAYSATGTKPAAAAIATTGNNRATQAGRDANTLIGDLPHHHCRARTADHRA